MGLFEKLPMEEVAMLRNYIHEYGDGDAIPTNHMDHYLRYWNTNKEKFYQAFGNEFIVKKDVFFNKSIEDASDALIEAFRGETANPIIADFINAYTTKICEIRSNYSVWDPASSEIHRNFGVLLDFVMSDIVLYENIYKGNGFTIPAKHTVNNKPFMVNRDCKVVKILSKICKALGVKVEEKQCPDCGRVEIPEDAKICPMCGKKLIVVDGYEMFRQAHSRVLNNKKTKGTLCLSIHPMDFITMSDNECGWDSCMSWMNDDGGDYRLGTVEMMNSPYVIVAYLEASKPMDIWGVGEWNNKRWRQLYIVDENVILGNRQYPYSDDELQGSSIKWIRELMSRVAGYGPYPEETCLIRNHKMNTIGGEKQVHFAFDTCYMYNDVYDSRLAYVADQNFESGDYYEVNFSGPAICSNCGCEIEYETVDPSNVCCLSCRGGWQCDSCGDWHNDYDDYYWLDDYKVCRYCYEDHGEQCECCNEYHYDNNMTYIYIQLVGHKENSMIDSFNYMYYVPLCEYCLSHPEAYEPLYGPMYDVVNCWGMRKKAFDIRNITDEGLSKGNLPLDIINMIEEMRESNSDEDCVRLVEKHIF